MLFLLKKGRPFTTGGFFALFFVLTVTFAVGISLAWYVCSLFALVAFVPFFYTINFRGFKRWQKHLLVFSLFFIYNVCVTYWLLFIKMNNGPLPLLANAIYLYLAYPLSLLLSVIIKNKSVCFIIALLFIEWLHFNWLFAWPWLTIGNVFGQTPLLIEWYRYTSVFGGSLWVLIIGALICHGAQLKYIIVSIALPIFFSLLLYKLDLTSIQTSKNYINTVLSQPNFKYEPALPDAKKIDSLILNTENVLAKQSSPNLIVYPELCLSGVYWKETFTSSGTFNKLNLFLKQKHPNTKILIGSRLNVLTDEKDSTDVQIKKRGNFVFRNYNVAIAIDTSKKVKFKSKKLFIPKTEIWPYFFDYLLPDSTSCNYSVGNDTNIMQIGKVKLFLAICYESVFTNYCSEANRDDIDLIVIMASESFLNNNKTAINQYLNIARIRAVENQKFVVKCSNQGISAIINPSGDIISQLSNQKNGYISVNIPVLR